MTDNEQRYKKALEELKFICSGTPILETIRQKIDAALNPPPEYEEVEVVRWAKLHTNGEWLGSTSSEEQAHEWLSRNTGNRITKLTGIDRRPIKPKVKRSKLFKDMPLGELYTNKEFYEFTDTMDKADVRIEWEE